MIKNDNGNIEVGGGKVPDLVLEWMQLTQALASGIEKQTGVKMDLEKLILFGTEMLNKSKTDKSDD